MTPETDTSELKPCPHCGKPAMWLHKSQGGYAIICGGTPRCRAAVGLHGGGTSFTEVEALTAWNTRVAVDDLTLDELRGRAIRALREAGWRANDKLSLHSVIETMIAFGINIIRDKPASCGWPDCGCDADAVCNAALVPAPAATMEGAEPFGWAYYRDGQKNDADHPILTRKRWAPGTLGDVWTEIVLYADPAPAAPTLEALPKDTARFKSLSTVDDEAAPAPTLEADGLVERRERLTGTMIWRTRAEVAETALSAIQAKCGGCITPAEHSEALAAMAHRVDTADAAFAIVERERDGERIVAEYAESANATLQADFNDCNSERARWKDRTEAAEAKVLALTTALTEATIKVENDRTLWNTEWQQWLHLARAALSPDKGA